MVWAGTSSDIFKARSIGALVLVGLSISTLLMALNPTVWLLPFLIFLLRFLGQGMLPHISSVSMSRWFISQRGKLWLFLILDMLWVKLFFQFLYNTNAELSLAKLMDCGVLILFADGAYNLDVVEKRKNPQSLAKEVTALGLLGKSGLEKKS